MAAKTQWTRWRSQCQHPSRFRVQLKKDDKFYDACSPQGAILFNDSTEAKNWTAHFVVRLTSVYAGQAQK